MAQLALAPAAPLPAPRLGGVIPSGELRLRAARTQPGAAGGQRLRVSEEPVHPDVDREGWLLHVRYHERRDPADRRRLVERYHPHARALARRFYRGGDPVEDLEQVAAEALLLALDRFDPERGLPFLGFATPTIIGSIKRHYRDLGWGIRVPRRVHDLASPLRDAWEQLSQDLGRAPTRGELADLVGVTEAEVSEALAADEGRTTDSLDRPTELGELGDLLGLGDRGLDLAVDRAALAQALEVLSDLEREVLRLYFLEEQTQTEVAARLGVSQMQVSRQLARTLGRLRSHL